MSTSVIGDRSFSDILISAIVPSYNSLSENERIDKLLSYIMKQTYRNFEIIVVDNFSIDRVREICEQFPVRFFKLKSTISEARNYGLEKARGDFAIFLDCDQLPPPKLFEECISLVKSEDADCVIIEIESVSTEPKKQKHFIDCVNMHNIEVRAGIGTTGTKLPLFYSIRLIGSERFPPKVQLGEDFVFASLIIKKKSKILKAKSRILHCEDPSIKSLVKRSWHYGREFVYLQKNSREANMFISNISVFNFMNSSQLFSLLFSKPKVILPFACYLWVKYFSFLMGYLSEKFFSLLKRS